ncbi:hypothetical protein PQC11_gp147 [Synechococcus phage S-H9-1]|uniref:DUF7201 domain-containing protein n=1 Tax=Synechococcus phage S-H9-1 TaxID=2783674 RepID=A0A873WKK2_9CAUD|nr:hypothetical protein PQC11_gp147 [Synechococcus phage S-H9-1]QPB08181.1 hypothetical protein [Synechococcus phage S-H9-1]
MKYQKPINNVNNNDEFSSGLMEAYGRWMGGDTFQNTTISEAPFDGMDPQSNGAEIEDTTKRKKTAKKGGYVGQESAPKNEEVEVLEREEYEIDGETYVIEKAKGLDGKACWKGYKLAGTKMKGGKRVDNCVKAGVEYEGDELTEGKEKCPKCMGEGCKHCDDTGYHTVKEYFEKENGKMVKKHNCAAKVKKEGKEYFCIPEQHTMLEDGTVTHYDLVSEQGEVLRNVPVTDLEIVTEKMHEHVVNYAKNAEVLGEKKLDPVNHKELKGDHADRKDKDIDNDGDVDKSDKYLHARRKKVSKIIAMSKKK